MQTTKHHDNLTSYVLIESICYGILLLTDKATKEGAARMDNEVKEMLQLILKGQEELKQDVLSLKQGQEELKQELSDVKQLATKTAIVQENEIAQKIQLIYENQMTIIEHNSKLKTYDNRMELLENDVFILKYAFKALKQG